MYSCHNDRFSLVIEDQVVHAVPLFLTGTVKLSNEPAQSVSSESRQQPWS